MCLVLWLHFQLPCFFVFVLCLFCFTRFVFVLCSGVLSVFSSGYAIIVMGGGGTFSHTFFPVELSNYYHFIVFLTEKNFFIGHVRKA